MTVPFPGGIVRMNPETRVVNVNWSNLRLEWVVVECRLDRVTESFLGTIPCSPADGNLSVDQPYDAFAAVSFGYATRTAFEHLTASDFVVGFMTDGADVYPETYPTVSFNEPEQTYGANAYMTSGTALDFTTSGSSASAPSFISDYFGETLDFKSGSTCDLEWQMLAIVGGPECWTHLDGVNRTIWWSAGRASSSDPFVTTPFSDTLNLPTGDITLEGTIFAAEDFVIEATLFEFVGAAFDVASGGDALVRVLYRRKPAA